MHLRALWREGFCLTHRWGRRRASLAWMQSGWGMTPGRAGGPVLIRGALELGILEGVAVMGCPHPQQVPTLLSLRVRSVDSSARGRGRSLSLDHPPPRDHLLVGLEDVL